MTALVDGWMVRHAWFGRNDPRSGFAPISSLRCGQLVFLPVVNDDVFMLSRAACITAQMDIPLLALSLLYAMLWPSYLFPYHVKAVGPEMFCRTWDRDMAQLISKLNHHYHTMTTTE